MLEKFIYQNSKGEVIDFGKDGIFVNESDLHNYEWSVREKNERIAGFKRGIITKKLPVVVKCASTAEGTAARNLLTETFEKDVLSGQHGRIIIGEYYLPCFVVKSEKKQYLVGKDYMVLNLTLKTDSAYWVKENFYSFTKTESTDDGMEYPFDHPFDFSNSYNTRKVFNGSIVPCNFKIIVHGSATNPEVAIGGNLYKVSVSLEATEFLTIDSRTKRIFVTDEDGNETNVFRYRNLSNYIFAKIPSGELQVNWTGNFDVDVILYDERSEPKWI